MKPIVYKAIIKEAPDALSGARMLDNAREANDEVTECEMHQRDDGKYWVSWKVPMDKDEDSVCGKH